MSPRPVTVALATRHPVSDVSAEQAALEAVGARLSVIQVSDEASLIAGLREADLAINRSYSRYRPEVLDQLDRCRAILQPSTGYDAIDVDAATERGIVVINLPFQCLDEVVNHAIAFILALNRKLDVAQAQVRAGVWNPRGLLPIGPLTGETLGLLGFGNIARETGRRAQVFRLNVIAYDPFVNPGIAREMNVELVSLDDLLQRADYISCHLPLNPKTRHSIGAEQFRRMKPSAIFVNTARGPIVDEPALIEALRSGQIAAAGLDVLEQEPPDPNNPLLHMENVMVTPHLAGTSDATPPRQRQHVINNMVAYVKGERPEGLINPAAWERAQARLRG